MIYQMFFILGEVLGAHVFDLRELGFKLIIYAIVIGVDLLS